MRIQALCLALCVLAPAAASANNQIDIFYAPMTTLGDDEAAIKEHGFGARLRADTGQVLIGFEYSTTSDYAFFEESIDQLRLGLGVKASDLVSVHGQYLNWDFLGADVDGFGAHIQFGGQAAEGADGYFRLGYLTLDDEDGYTVDGFEYSVGATFPLASIRGLVEFRSSQLEDEDGFKLYLEDVRVGLSFPFGG